MGSCNAGPVGSCAVVGCYPSRGPTRCMGNSCMCQHGYCEAGAALKECRAQVGTCAVLPCSPTAHGGIAATECINGYCLCHTGYHAGGADGKICERGWWPPKETAMIANNTGLRGTIMSDAQPEVLATTEAYNPYMTNGSTAEALAMIFFGMALMITWIECVNCCKTMH